MVWSTPHSIGTSRSAPRALERIQMSADERVTKPDTERGKPRVHRLKPNAVGLWGVMFIEVATAPPITAMIADVRRVGHTGVSPCRHRWSQSTYKKQAQQ